MPTRRVVEHKARTLDNEKLRIITVYEEGLNKERVKRESRLSKRHGILVRRGKRFEYKD